MSSMKGETDNKHEIALTHGGEPLDSNIATPKTDMKAPNQIKEGTTAPNIPSSKGTTIT